MEFQNPNTFELTTERIEAIKLYISLQENFLALAKKGILTSITVKYLNEEIDIDNITEGMQSKLDKASVSEREALVKKLPKTKRGYPFYYIKPFYIGNELDKRDVNLDGLETDHINTINTHIQDKLETYKLFIK